MSTHPWTITNMPPIYSRQGHLITTHDFHRHHVCMTHLYGITCVAPHPDGSFLSDTIPLPSLCYIHWPIHLATTKLIVSFYSIPLFTALRANTNRNTYTYTYICPLPLPVPTPNPHTHLRLYKSVYLYICISLSLSPHTIAFYHNT